MLTEKKFAQDLAKSRFVIEEFCDDLGPTKVVHIFEPVSQLRAIVVIDNVACGPSIGGVRMAADVTTTEVFRLARAMTLKNAAAGLAHGGGKSGILADPKTCDKQKLIREFARAIRDLNDYIPGPDMGTDETCMAWIHQEIKRSVGLPKVLGGIPLDEIGATGYGVAASAEVAADFCDLELQGATVAIEGFGNVGRHAARFLRDNGAVLVAASDSRGTIYNPAGIDVEQLSQVKSKSGSVTAYENGSVLDNAEIFGLECDILVPAARPDCINAENANDIKARLILQGANIPATAEAEQILFQRGVLIVPDFICNAGGVICAAAEYHGGTQRRAFEEIQEKISRNTREVLTRSQDEKIEPRTAASALARERVKSAMQLRGETC
jgi:glutamate dehydrogenase (NAD(P)+)/glutamate dehydrogenase (NADP+)